MQIEEEDPQLEGAAESGAGAGAGAGEAAATGAAGAVPGKSAEELLEQGIMKGNLKMVKRALEQKVTLRPKQRGRKTSPLMLACGVSGKGNTDIIVELLEKEADIHLRDYQGWNSMHHASCHGCISVLEVLFSHGGRRHDLTATAQTTLMLAAESGHSRVAALLLEKGGSKLNDFVTVVDNAGCTALHYACKRGCVDCVTILMDNNVKLNLKDKAGRTALTYACQAGKATIVKVLIQGGANINTRDELGQGPIFYACLGGHDSLACLLLKKKGDAEAKNQDGDEPMSVARKLNLTKLLHDFAKLRWELEVQEMKANM